MRDYLMETYFIFRKYGLLEMVRSDYYFALSRLIMRFSFLNNFVNPPLRSLALEITNNCNLNCDMCHSGASNRIKGFMDYDVFTNIVDELDSKIANKGKFPISLNYAGESLLHNRFVDMLAYLSGKGFKNLSLSTNGSLLSPKISDAFLKYSVGMLNISLDGLKDSHERIRQGSKYDLVIKNIMYIVNKRHSLNQSVPSIRVNLIKNSHTNNEISSFVDEWINVVDRVSISEMIDMDFRYVTRNSVLDAFFKNNKRSPCLDVYHGMSILWNGQVTLCCHDLSGRGSLDGNVITKGVFGVWNSSEYKKIRSLQSKRNYSNINICRKCEAWAKRYTNGDSIDVSRTLKG